MITTANPTTEGSIPGGDSYTSEPPYRIFISYSREDKLIASALHVALVRLYPQSADLKVDLMKEFEPGSQWRKHIDECLTNADLLLLVYTGQLKPSHSWTGYEIGFFSREIQRRSERFKHVQREIIPINFLGKREAVTEVIEGIEFSRDAVTRPEMDIAQLGLTSDGFMAKFSEGPLPTDPLFRLLRKIANNVEVCTSRPPRSDEDRDRRDSNLRREVVDLYSTLHSLIRQRQREDQGLQSKIIVSIVPGKDTRDGTIISAIEFQNSAETVFQLAEALRSLGSTRLDWNAFQNEVSERNDKQVAALWIANLSELVRSAQPGEFVDSNVLFPSHDQKKTYRAVVTRRVEFYSGGREIHIYLFELYQGAEYGDPGTSVYLNALEVACRYRSLFLEPMSQFAPHWMFPHEDNRLKSEVLRMVRELDLIHQDSLENKLNTTQGLGLVYGEDGAGLVTKIKKQWTAAEEGLRTAAANLLHCNEASKFASARTAFEEQLVRFCLETNPVNADYLKRAILKLEKRTAELMVQLEETIKQWKARSDDSTKGTGTKEA